MVDAYPLPSGPLDPPGFVLLVLMGLFPLLSKQSGSTVSAALSLNIADASSLIKISQSDKNLSFCFLVVFIFHACSQLS